jgi:hypothetical protein
LNSLFRQIQALTPRHRIGYRRLRLKFSPLDAKDLAIYTR